MKKSFLAKTFILIIILLVFFNLYLYFDNKKILEVYNIPSDIHITQNRTAFELSKDNTLHFGSIPYNGSFSATRIITFNNTYPYNIKVYLLNKNLDKNILVSFSENKFILKPGETKKIVIETTPSNASINTYYWNTTVIIKKV